MTPKTTTRLFRLRDFALGMGLIALVWYGIGYLIDANAELVERLEQVTVVVGEDASQTEVKIKGAKASLNSFNYTYEVGDVTYDGSDSTSSRLSVRERTLDGKDVLTATGYYDPQDPGDSYLEKPNTWLLGKVRIVLVVILSLASIAALFDDRDAKESARVKANSRKRRRRNAERYAQISSDTLPSDADSMSDGDRYQGPCAECGTDTDVRLTQLDELKFGICMKCYFSDAW